jgi:hypothetical protein
MRWSPSWDAREEELMEEYKKIPLAAREKRHAK